MSSWGVVTALTAEARTLGRSMPRSDGLSQLDDGRLLAVGGIGGACATAASRRLIEAGAAALVSFGFAGALDPALGAGAVVLPVEIVSRGEARFATSHEWRQRLRAALVARRDVSCGRLLSDVPPIDSAAAKAAAFRESGAVAVDMESFAIAQVAAAARVPFIALRVIVDTARDALPRSVVAASLSGRLQTGRLLKGLASAPWEVVELVRLAVRYRAALRSLAQAARAGLA